MAEINIEKMAQNVAQKALQELRDNGVVVSRWIPVNESLPENRNQEVIISLEWGVDIGRYSDGEWHSEWINHYDDGDILAWMPLPKRYDPQEKGAKNDKRK